MRDAANAILEEQDIFPGIDLVLFTEFNAINSVNTDKEFGTLSEEELEAIQSTQNDEHLTKLATGESAEVIKHDLTSEYNKVTIATNIFDSVSEKREQHCKKESLAF